jgi:endonuclease YncB( thermonuclease family)
MEASGLVMLAAALAGLAAAGPALGQTRAKGELIAGPAVVIDGHTLSIAGTRVRLWGIFAPEGGDWCYRFDQRWKPAAEAAVALRTCLEDKPATCRVQRVEGRWLGLRKSFVAECWNEGGHDLGDCMVRAGWAADYTCYSGGYYQDLEQEVRNKRAGLWSCDGGAPVKRWGRLGHGSACEAPPYRPLGPDGK